MDGTRDGLARFAEENVKLDKSNSDWWIVAGYAYSQGGEAQAGDSLLQRGGAHHARGRAGMESARELISSRHPAPERALQIVNRALNVSREIDRDLGPAGRDPERPQPLSSRRRPRIARRSSWIRASARPGSGWGKPTCGSASTLKRRKWPGCWRSSTRRWRGNWLLLIRKVGDQSHYRYLWRLAGALRGCSSRARYRSIFTPGARFHGICHRGSFALPPAHNNAMGTCSPRGDASFRSISLPGK